MGDPLSSNKGFTLPPNASHPGTWDQPVNLNTQEIDAVFGNVTTLNAQGASGNIVLTASQYRPVIIVITGVPGGAITYQLPAAVGGFYFIDNRCTGANAAVSFGSVSVAPVATVPGGFSAPIVIDPTYGGRWADTLDTEAAGSTGQLQWNNNSVFAGAAGLIYTAPTQGLAIAGPLGVGGNFSVGGNMTSRLNLTAAAQTAVVPIPFSAGSMAVDCSLSNVFETTMSGTSAAPTLTNQAAGQTINWRFIQDGTGNRTISWPGNFRWPGGTAGVLSTTPATSDLLVATFFASTATWLANLVKGFTA